MQFLVVARDGNDDDALDARLRGDPYGTGDVWRTIEVAPFRRAV